jgi:hypothetical protein
VAGARESNFASGSTASASETRSGAAVVVASERPTAASSISIFAAGVKKRRHLADELTPYMYSVL